MNPRIFAFWLQAAIVLPLAAGQTIEIAKYPYPGGVVSVYFDPANVTRTDLDSWMRLSPSLSPYNDLLVPIDIRRCVSGDKEYTDCKTNGKLKVRNVEQNIRKIANIKKDLNGQKVPDGLRAIAAYLSEIQTFALWAAEQERTFLVTGDPAVFGSQYDGIGAHQNCASVLPKISGSAQAKDSTERVIVDWYNCVWALEKQKMARILRKIGRRF
jgi:hypothetical protein